MDFTNAPAAMLHSTNTRFFSSGFQLITNVRADSLIVCGGRCSTKVNILVWGVMQYAGMLNCTLPSKIVATQALQYIFRQHAGAFGNFWMHPERHVNPERHHL